MKFAVFAPVALTFATLGLAGCGHQQTPAADTRSGISVSDGRLVLPAVPGNPGAVYFTVHNDSDSKATLNGAHVDGAGMAMMHQTVMANGEASMQEMAQAEVPPRGALVFAPGGRHVMAMNLADTLKPGGTTNVTLTFADGGKATFPAEILAAGNAH